MGCMGRTGGNSVDTKSSGSSTSTTQNMTAEQKTAFDTLLKLYSPQAGVNDNIYPDNRVANFSDLQNSAVNSAYNFADLFNTPTQVGTPLFGETGNALEDLLSGKGGAAKTTPNQVDAYFNQNIKDPAMRMLNNDLLPTVDEGYTGGNFFSTARGKARDKMTTDVGNQLTQERSQLEWNTNQANQALDEAAVNRILAAINPAMQYGQIPYQGAMNNLGISAAQMGGLSDLFNLGQTQQTQSQTEIDSAIQKFAEDNQITDPINLAILLQLLGMPVSITTSETGTNKSSQNAYENSWKAGDWGSFGLQALALGMA